MLSYAYQVLNEVEFKDLSVEEFDCAGDLFAALLSRGIEIQEKKHLHREYTQEFEESPFIRGKIDIPQTINNLSFVSKKVVCCFDNLTPDSYLNEIIKTTLIILLNSNIRNKNKNRIKRILPLLKDVKTLDVRTINWNVKFNRMNNTYRMLIGLCYLTINGLIQTNETGTIRLMDFLDSQRFSQLYERFILEYYRRHYPELNPASIVINWQIENKNYNLLPQMKTDVVLQKDKNILIIDAKCYIHNTQFHYGRTTIISEHLYQIFAYVKNKEYELRNTYKVSGMLLYARTDESIQPNEEYLIMGNNIFVKNIDLNCNFQLVKKQLNIIADNYFQLISKDK